MGQSVGNRTSQWRERVLEAESSTRVDQAKRVRFDRLCSGRALTGAPTEEKKWLFAGVFESRRAHFESPRYGGGQTAPACLNPSIHICAAATKWSRPYLFRVAPTRRIPNGLGWSIRCFRSSAARLPW